MDILSNLLQEARPLYLEYKRKSLSYDVRSDRKATSENNHKPVSPKHSKHK